MRDISIRPYVIGDYEFGMEVNVMITYKKKRISADTQEQMECSFGILKHPFLFLQQGAHMQHKEEIFRLYVLILALAKLNNMCIDCGDSCLEPLDPFEMDLNSKTNIVSLHRSKAKKRRDSLIYYATNN